jgi:hypothetical protein
LKRVLIISPYFPPVNAADMQRVRMSLPYFREFGWTCEVVAVRERHAHVTKDPLLLQSLPVDTVVHHVQALSYRITSRIGLGSIALRSLWFYRKKVNALLRAKKFDLVYFSTTQFPVCILGAHWKKKFGVPYVVDLQDPWYSDYYKDKPKNERPPKYWFSSRLDHYTERIGMKSVDGLISVSNAYLETLAQRYPRCREIPSSTITFGAFAKDAFIAFANRSLQPSVLPVDKEKIKIVYIGRGGADMKDALRLVFLAFRECLEAGPSIFRNFHFYFIGTSYAAAGEGRPTIAPLAEAEGIGDYVTEKTDRIPFYQSLNTLAAADALLIPGSNDPGYTASKIYPYIMAEKPMLALFHPDSSVVKVLKECKVGTVLNFGEDRQTILSEIKNFLGKLGRQEYFRVKADPEAFEQYSARTMTQRQCELFNQVVL